MTETAEQYITRLVGYVAGRDPIAMQSETPGILAHLIDGVPAETLKARPAPGKWSVAEILMHMAEDELASCWRYRQMLEYDTPPLPGFDQELWARLGGYTSGDPQDALTLFRLLRETNLRMFSRLTPEQWERGGIHSERGRTSVRELCLHLAGHDVNHIGQIRRILGSPQ